MKIAHLTTVHGRYDGRIFWKECSSLSDAGHQVYLVVADGKGNEQKGTINIIDVGPPGRRIRRIYDATKRVLQAARNLDADVYHIHDPELIPRGLQLIRDGKKVIFDAHEDFPQQILSKNYLSKLNRKLLSHAVAVLEIWALRKFSHVITATPHIKEKFQSAGIRSTAVNNFPLMTELSAESVDKASSPGTLVYIGGITTLRGIRIILSVLETLGGAATLNLAGVFQEAGLQTELEAMPGWKYVNYAGMLDRAEVSRLVAESSIGLVTLLPTAAYIHSLPIKMFEYMSAGIPIIASDFPLWRGIVEESGCGILVNPQDVSEIAAAVSRLIGNPLLAREMGDRGRAAVLDRYNWDREAVKLIRVYSEI